MITADAYPLYLNLTFVLMFHPFARPLIKIENCFSIETRAFITLNITLPRAIIWLLQKNILIDSF
ncbi:hypothetical protein PRO82_001260 [Candidatus Protochlamydia amoebophila]|nr:hypothetical protein [Candidatus Protochlamydia amoebophila]